jgi:acyl-CoA synthetase (AMP-forming)/AMP-acid ligase II
VAQVVRIVNPDSREPLPPGVVGEIWVAGASVARGYWELPEVSAETMRATLDLDALAHLDEPSAAARLDPGHRASDYARPWRQPVVFRAVRVREQQRAGAVVDAGSITGGDGPRRTKRRRQLRERRWHDLVERLGAEAVVAPVRSRFCRYTGQSFDWASPEETRTIVPLMVGRGAFQASVEERARAVPKPA